MSVVWFGLPPETMWMSEHCAELALPLSLGSMREQALVMWVQES